MADGIGRLSGYGNYGVGGYVPNRNQNENNTEVNENQNQVNNNAEDTKVDPKKVMDFLANNNYFIPQTSETKVGGVNLDNLDADAKERIAGFVENYVMIMNVIEQEFGAEKAPYVMDMVMDVLMGMLNSD